MTASFEIFPLLPAWYYVLIAVVAALVVGAAFYRKSWDFFWRAGFLALAAFLLLNPVMMNEVREAQPDKVLIVVDESASQKIGKRDDTAAAALKHIESKLKNTESTIIRVNSSNAGGKGESTNLFSAIRDSLMNIPAAQAAGVILITDGQVHDVPAEAGVLSRLGPFHAVLTGSKNEFDRKVTIVSAPKYGVLDSDVTLRVRIDEFGKKNPQPVAVSAFQDGQASEETILTAGEERDFTFKLKHPGQNVFEFRIPAEEGELTAHNNTAPVIINAVRDRLRVLLVSGSPHMGERAWRNLLKSDPSIDLVHFTILRSPTAMDPTPQSELSLIVFPVDELFERKIKDFDLIIFDRYHQYGLFMPQYFTNITEFVKDGGAMLMAFSNDDNDRAVFDTSIGDLLPVAPRMGADDILRRDYLPALTDTGKRHPATADIGRRAEGKWGKWFSQSAVDARRGETLMTGIDGNPLMVIDKVGDGRVAVLASDNIWLWSKGGAEAGPYTEVLRSLSHWLMKEPELEDDFIKAEFRGKVIRVALRDIGTEEKTVTAKKPSGQEEVMTLREKRDGWVIGDLMADENGVYGFTRGDKQAFVVVGTAENAEFSDVHTTDDKLAPLIKKTGGGVVWFRDQPDFDINMQSSSSKNFGGGDNIGLRRNGAYAVSRVETSAIMPDWLWLLLILPGIMWMWRREGGVK